MWPWLLKILTGKSWLIFLTLMNEQIFICLILSVKCCGDPGSPVLICSVGDNRRPRAQEKGFFYCNEHQSNDDYVLQTICKGGAACPGKLWRCNNSDHFWRFKKKGKKQNDVDIYGLFCFGRLLLSALQWTQQTKWGKSNTSRADVWCLTARTALTRSTS